MPIAGLAMGFGIAFAAVVGIVVIVKVIQMQNEHYCHEHYAHHSDRRGRSRSRNRNRSRSPEQRKDSKTRRSSNCNDNPLHSAFIELESLLFSNGPAVMKPTHHSSISTVLDDNTDGHDSYGLRRRQPTGATIAAAAESSNNESNNMHTSEANRSNSSNLAPINDGVYTAVVPQSSDEPYPIPPVLPIASSASSTEQVDQAHADPPQHALAPTVEPTSDERPNDEHHQSKKLIVPTAHSTTAPSDDALPEASLSIPSVAAVEATSSIPLPRWLTLEKSELQHKMDLLTTYEATERELQSAESDVRSATLRRRELTIKQQALKNALYGPSADGPLSLSVETTACVSSAKPPSPPTYIKDIFAAAAVSVEASAAIVNAIEESAPQPAVFMRDLGTPIIFHQVESQGVISGNSVAVVAANPPRVADPSPVDPASINSADSHPTTVRSDDRPAISMEYDISFDPSCTSHIGTKSASTADSPVHIQFSPETHHSVLASTEHPVQSAKSIFWLHESAHLNESHDSSSTPSVPVVPTQLANSISSELQSHSSFDHVQESTSGSYYMHEVGEDEIPESVPWSDDDDGVLLIGHNNS
ncbi:hypothetical protein BASA50_003761 [Batrachochytrium salamandrivorans]|uniref:Uncharacterized protein n=1 Tax=Batrachochytrium salamandrivorans TaxID=1357716 RepID=A0ABQ8FIE3_9FUNG|nr:hypothetical protein BASA50_003761 [Batrachochytrium salamandrivorans]KAH6602474.1 hypothetical protein BASA61_001081 [Batrachochytrium salamandrivorans]KAH9264167.1 hypothetical protein BASA83_012365 [Batrachochytrium salamandrivorans]